MQDFTKKVVQLLPLKTLFSGTQLLPFHIFVTKNCILKKWRQATQIAQFLWNSVFGQKKHSPTWKAPSKPLLQSPRSISTKTNLKSKSYRGWIWIFLQDFDVCTDAPSLLFVNTAARQGKREREREREMAYVARKAHLMLPVFWRNVVKSPQIFICKNFILISFYEFSFAGYIFFLFYTKLAN